MSAPTLTVYADGQGTIFADGLNTFAQTCDTFADIQSFIGIEGVQVEVRGGNVIGDGLGGVFYWNENGTLNDGVNNIMPFGAALGTWSRLSVFPNPILFPFEESTTLPAARTALGLGSIATQNANNVNITGGTISNVTFAGIQTWFNQQQIKTSAYTVVDNDAGTTLVLEGNAFYQLTFNTPASYRATFFVFITNSDTTRGKRISINGSFFILWPQQNLIVFADNTSLFQFVGGPIRWQLTSNITLFASVSGSSNNDGLGSDFPLDLQTAINLCTQGAPGIGTGIDFNAHSVVVQCADGTYSGQFSVLGGMLGSDVFTIQGNVGTPSNVKIVSSGPGVAAIFARDAGRVQIQSLEVACGAGGFAISASQGGVVDLSNVIFGDCSSANAMSIQEGGAINFVGPVSIAGNFVAWMFVQGGYVSLGGQIITIQNAVSGSFILDMVRGSVESNAGTATFVNPGNYSGTSYIITANAVFVRNGTTLPGSAGSTATGGQVI